MPSSSSTGYAGIRGRPGGRPISPPVAPPAGGPSLPHGRLRWLWTAARRATGRPPPS